MYPLRHCGTAYQAEILGAASGAEMADVKQIQQMIPHITCEISFNQHVCELVFGVNVTEFEFWCSHNPVKRTIQSNSVGSVKHASLWDFDLL